MRLLPIHSEITEYLQRHQLEKKFKKQVGFLITDSRHPGLNVELLEPKDRGIYSFRVDIRYRALFFYRKEIGMIEILAVTDHYK